MAKPHCRSFGVSSLPPQISYFIIYIYDSVSPLKAQRDPEWTPRYGNEFVKYTGDCVFKMKNKHFQKPIKYNNIYAKREEIKISAKMSSLSEVTESLFALLYCQSFVQILTMGNHVKLLEHTPSIYNTSKSGQSQICKNKNNIADVCSLYILSIVI